MLQTDVLIIGAGPAGCAAAYFLARQGIEATLIDRAEFPRAKTCGDGLSPPVVALLRETGLVELPAGAQRVHRTRVYAPGGRFLESFSSMPGVVMERREFDRLLLERATAAGARFRPRTEFTGRRVERDGVVIETRGSGLIRARCAVLATGANAAALRAAGVPAGRARVRAFGLRAYFENVDGAADTITLAYDRRLLPFYGWVFPLGGGRANVGIGCELGGRRGNPRDRFERFLAESPPVRQMLAKARRISPVAGAPLRVGYRAGRWPGERMVAVGEALCGTNPLSGEGIYAAILTGRLAAEILAPALRRGDGMPEAVRAYGAAAWRMLGSRFRRAEWLRCGLRAPFLMDRLIGCARNNPKLADIASYTSVGDANPLNSISWFRLLRMLMRPTGD